MTDKNVTDGEDLIKSMVVGGRTTIPVIEDSQQNNSVNKEVEETESEDNDSDEGFDEEYIRLVTKDGVEYLLGAPLPPTKGFIVNEQGMPIIWNPNSLRMEQFIPEQVEIKRISLFHIKGADDVFRVFCIANDNSEYKKQGLAVVRTIPFVEISSWDTIVDESMLFVDDIDFESNEEGE